MADQPVLIKVSTGKEIPVPEQMLIGRHADCDLQLSEGQTSRRHAKLTVAADGAWLEDLGSANGTFVNGVQLIARVRLNSGDRLRFDIEEFDIRLPMSAQPPPPSGDDGKTVFRAPDAPAAFRAPDPQAAAVVAESSGIYKRPGAWADPDAMGEAGNKTKFIDPAHLKQMIDAPKPGTITLTAIDGPHLQVVSGSRAGLNIKLMVGEAGMKEWTIGSQADREIQFQDSGVSSLHAKIINEGARWKVLDQMSANGTFVNGKRSNVSYLTAGDRLRFGPIECIFQTERTAPYPRSSASNSGSGGKTLVIGITAFVVTIVVLLIVYKFAIN